MIERTEYLQVLRKMKDKEFIKVITGVRRSGKSTILQLWQEELRAQDVSEGQIQMFNFEDLANDVYLDYRVLYQRIEEHLQANAMNYVFLDEIQMVDQFERVLDSLFIKKNVDLYVTGSNAYMLSGELATLLSGRCVEIKVLPLSFAELYSYEERENGLATSVVFEQFLERGGFPYASMIEDDQTYLSYVNGIVNTVLVKDILTRKKLSNATLVEELARFLADTSGSVISIKKIADTLTSKGYKTSSDTVAGYLDAFTEAYLFYRCDRFDLHGKKLLSRGSKYYPVDPAIRRALLGRKRPDYGHRLEGVVYLELTRRGYDVYVGSIENGEVDFIAQKDGATEYYQVSASVLDNGVYQRESEPLGQIQDNYPKIILTMDAGTYNDQGLLQMNMIDWLLA